MIFIIHVAQVQKLLKSIHI